MRMHIRLSIIKRALIVLLFFVPVTYASADASAKDEALFFPLPVQEVRTVIARWLLESGYTVTGGPSEAGQIEINAVRARERWNILLKPYSPLASRVTAAYSVDGLPVPGRTGQLNTLISRYKNSFHEEIPRAVALQKKHVVCMQAGTGEGYIQFSGFILGTDGLIISTAHDLDGVRYLKVVLADGEVLKGRVIKTDFDRDLSLTDLDMKMDSSVSLINARNILQEGEMIYSIGCSGDYQSRIYSGIIHGPLGLVNSHPLWQAEMKTLHGSSGGPVFDSEGNLSGVVKGRYRGTDSRGFLITIETLADFLKED